MGIGIDLGGPEMGMCGMIKWVDLAPNPFLRRNEVGWWSFSKNISKERTKWDGEREIEGESEELRITNKKLIFFIFYNCIYNKLSFLIVYCNLNAKIFNFNINIAAFISVFLS